MIHFCQTLSLKGRTLYTEIIRNPGASHFLPQKRQKFTKAVRFGRTTATWPNFLSPQWWESDIEKNPLVVHKKNMGRCETWISWTFPQRFWLGTGLHESDSSELGRCSASILIPMTKRPWRSVLIHRITPT